jgi:hypothetical protein
MESVGNVKQETYSQEIALKQRKGIERINEKENLPSCSGAFAI